MEREQTKRIKREVAEFNQLKNKLFKTEMFVILNTNDPELKKDMDRYDQLLKKYYLGGK